MKKSNLFLVSSLNIFLCSTVFASTLHKDEPPKLLFCPEKIECSEEGKLSSCKLIGENLQYWEDGWISENGKINKGVYTFGSVTALYQYSGVSNTACLYHNSESGFPKTITYTPNAANFEAFPRESKWTIIGYNAACISFSSSASCPLVEKPEVFFNGCDADGCFISHYKIYANNILIKDSCNSSGGSCSVHTTLTYEEATVGCGSAGECKIDIISSDPGYVIKGSAVIDLSNNMKTHCVISDSSNVKGKIQKKGVLNTIQFVRIK